LNKKLWTTDKEWYSRLGIEHGEYLFNVKKNSLLQNGTWGVDLDLRGSKYQEIGDIS
jgi:hypothetical protein